MTEIFSDRSNSAPNVSHLASNTVGANVSVRGTYNVLSQPEVAVPAVTCSLTNAQLIVLQQLLASFSGSGDTSGVTEYVATVTYLNNV